MRAKVASTTLAIASLLVAVGSLVGSWATPDWWETIPMVPFVIAAGVLAAGAVYLRVGRLITTLSVGLVVGVVTLVATGAVGCSRWCS
jgi:MFS superfamily sulfate permease-like transporter